MFRGPLLGTDSGEWVSDRCFDDCPRTKGDLDEDNFTMCFQISDNAAGSAVG